MRSAAPCPIPRHSLLSACHRPQSDFNGSGSRQSCVRYDTHSSPCRLSERGQRMLQTRGPKRLRFSLKSPPRFEELRRFPFGCIERSTGASGAISSTLGVHRFCVTFVTVGFRLISVDRQSSGECPLPPISVVPAGHRPHGRSAQLATARHPAHWVLAGMFATGLGSDFCLLRDFQSIIDLNA